MPANPPAPTAVATVAGRLREQILDAELAPGAPLREEALTAEHGVNRHTVRAAVRALEAERLVTIEPYRGARVRAFAAADVRALLEYRTALEAEAVRLLGERMRGVTDAGDALPLPRPVIEANERLREVCRSHPHDHRGIETAHADLHHALVAAAGSPRITEAHARLESELLLFLNQLRPLLPADEMADQHDRFLEAVARRGAEAVREHLAHSAQQLIGLLEP
ncbi:GntR family transcriptional regulator [Herbiconiux sp. CPCC 203407]|uniref:GntR family transcriptional regulator n=1 Tax=Herbiconiux oxytropis TaxID=2970915 RepID=A0AA42BVP0_9MICO|nr:GntR family transcriptional regulator [Herbiconiux oxytropis]MCS5723327.1 GntR family transcriptional regulator [Herbiconiux oxytropis]MCS5727506.1 GntR family transcriptional regulator [Herbiconiux oxytropis]